MRVIEVSYNLAVPASKLDIIKYILTNGRHGKLFVSKEVKMNKYWSEQDPRTTSINCRCTIPSYDAGGTGGDL